MKIGRQKTIAFAITTLFSAGAIYALSFGTLPPADYTFVNSTEIKTIDPAAATGVPEGRIIWELFEGLTSWDPKTLKTIPAVAESWTVSDDKRTYTFKLRDNARWSNGKPVTAHDFVYSWRRFLHPGTAAEYAYEMWYVENAEKFSKLQFDIGDPVEIELPIKRENGKRTDSAREFAPGKLLRGKLVAKETVGASVPTNSVVNNSVVKTPEAGKSAVSTEASKSAEGPSPIYTVEIDGVSRKFQKEGKQGEAYKWMLFDFEHVAIKAIDASTLQVRSNHPVPYFLELTGFYPYAPVNQECIESFSEQDWLKPENLVSNGPYRLKSRRLRDRIRLEKSDTYWDRDNVKLNIVDALAVGSDSTGLNFYLTGQADWIETVPATVIPELLRQNRPDFQPSPQLATYYYRLNVTRPVMKDVRVRRALGLAINKRQIVENVTQSGQQPASSLVPPLISEYSPYEPAKCGDHNPTEARKLLAEAGYPGGRGFPKITIQYNSSDMHTSIAELVQYQWKTILGIDVALQSQEWGTYLDNQQNLKYDISRAGWGADYADPNTFLSMFVTNGGNNQTGWSNKQYDQLIRDAQQEPDEKKRAEMFHQAEQILMDEMPIIPVYFNVSTEMVQPYVRGVHRNYHNFHPLKAISIDQDAKARLQNSSKGN
ncbi:MAG: ABC transporter substrate-binding protein [Planctomycetota bacterium]|nr:ABC transporter substrate-binding protein [Planctomycetota bacterium]